MDDSVVAGHIEELVAEEHRLFSEATGVGLSAEQHARLDKVKLELDRYWDLLRQRRAREEFGLDPDFVGPRGDATIEHFEQ